MTISKIARVFRNSSDDMRMKPRRLPGLRPHRLYSAATADVIYREGRRILALTLASIAPLFGGLVLGLLFYGAFLLLLFPYVRSAPPPTVYCRYCDGAGWVRDLEPTDGRCPLCRHDLFAYYQHAVPTGRELNLTKLLEQEVRGGALIARQKAQGWWSRFWWPIH